MKVGDKVNYSFYPDGDQTQPLAVVEATVTKVTVDLEYGEGEEKKSVQGVNQSAQPDGNTFQLQELPGTPEPDPVV